MVAARAVAVALPMLPAVMVMDMATTVWAMVVMAVAKVVALVKVTMVAMVGMLGRWWGQRCCCQKSVWVRCGRRGCVWWR